MSRVSEAGRINIRKQRAYSLKDQLISDRFEDSRVWCGAAEWATAGGTVQYGVMLTQVRRHPLVTCALHRDGAILCFVTLCRRSPVRMVALDWDETASGGGSRAVAYRTVYAVGEYFHTRVLARFIGISPIALRDPDSQVKHGKGMQMGVLCSERERHT